MPKHYVQNSSFLAGELREEFRYRPDLDIWRHSAEQIINWEILASGALRPRPGVLSYWYQNDINPSTDVWTAFPWRLDGQLHIALLQVFIGTLLGNSVVGASVWLYQPDGTLVDSEIALSLDQANLNVETGLDYVVAGPSLWVTARAEGSRPSVVFHFVANLQGAPVLTGETQPAYRELPGGWELGELFSYNTADHYVLRQMDIAYGPWMPAPGDRVFFGEYELTITDVGWTNAQSNTFSTTRDAANGIIYPALLFKDSDSPHPNIPLAGFPISTAHPLSLGFKDAEDTAVGTAITFFESRLVVVGADVIATPVADRWHSTRVRASRTNDFSVLVPKYAARQDSAIDVEISTFASGACLWAAAGRDVAFFGFERGLVALKPGVDPTSIAFSALGVDGVAPVSPVVEDNTLYFVTPDRQRVVQLEYDFLGGRFRVATLNQLSTPVDNITSIAISPPVGDRVRQLFVCNGTQTVYVGHFSPLGNFIGWTRWQMPNVVHRVICDAGRLFFVCGDSGNLNLVIQEIGFHESGGVGDHPSVCGVSGSVYITTKADGPYGLMVQYSNGEWAWVGTVLASGGYLYYDETNIASNNRIGPADYAHISHGQPVKAVLFENFIATLKLWPPVALDGRGLSLSRTYRTISVRAAVHRTAAIDVNGIVRLPHNGPVVLESQLYTGFWDVLGFRYNEERADYIRNVSCAPVTVLGAVREVEVS